MRILQLRFKNLNSLEGCWHIDLEHPAFTADGIFAITGPTGAGKTTILDAICLALYGRTPRLSKLSKTGNEIMSRQRGECFAEVVFATQNGRYRCHWSQRRARKRPDGELQPPKHEIADADSGTIFEATIRGVAERVEAVTGMDFDRFTRSMLLAQGGFAAFLQAAPDERAPILEQITGTEIYSRISTRVHELRQREREKLQLLQAESAGITLLAPEQEEAIQQTLTAQQQEEQKLIAQVAAAEQAMAWLAAIEALEKELTLLTDEANRLANDIKAFGPERDRLAQALNAASLDALYATLTAARNQQIHDGKALQAVHATLSGLAASAREQAETLRTAELHCARIKAERQEAAPVLRQLRALDQQLSAQNKAVQELQADCRKDAAKVAAEQKAREKEQEKLAQVCAALARIESYCTEHAADAWLVAHLAGVEEQVGALLLHQEEILRRQSEHEQAADVLKRAEQALVSRQRQTGMCGKALAQATQQLQQGKEGLNRLLGERLLREYRAEKEHLLREMAFLARIAELETLRTQLKDGSPCPLCGASEHPFARGNVPVATAGEERIAALSALIDQAEAREAAIEGLKESEHQARDRLVAAEKAEAAAVHQQEIAAQTLAERKESLEKLRAAGSEGRHLLAARLSPLGIGEPAENELSPLLANLRARLQTWQLQAENKADSEKKKAGVLAEIQRLEAVIDTQKSALNDRWTRLEALQKELAAGYAEREARYGNKNPEHEERRLDATFATAEAAEKRARERHGVARQQWQAAMTQIRTLRERMRGQEPELHRLEGEFAAALAPLGFTDEEEFLQAGLAPAQREALVAQARKLDERQTELGAQRKERETRLATELAKKLSEEGPDALVARHKDCERALYELREDMASRRHTLKENKAAAERVREKRESIALQERECRRWENLHALIGSADGKKYRNFAQGLTFELMVAHANRQLRGMTDRYLLIRDTAQPLELNVVDSYQAGEIRSTKNLSGGESFIVSLALALGLSQMASQKVRVDSLFLDEGFGTLDEESLDTALETLAGLQRDGKLIGIISHVPALKERIAAQILVSPQSGGTSLLSGPGCRLVSAAKDEAEKER